MMFKHVRPDMFQRKNKKNQMVMVYPDSSGITICYRSAETRTDGQWVLVGVSFCPPQAKFWNRKTANVVARARAFDSPTPFQFEGLDEDLSDRHVFQAVRTFLIEEPRWEPVDMNPVRPGRFTQRYGAALLGPGGSLLTAYIDVKPRSPYTVPDDDPLPRKVVRLPPRGSIEKETELLISHWSLRVPSWARTLVRSA